MAKSKVGGSRAYIRGRIGADVYSIGKDGKGSRQQVVRSLAEQVSNPRTAGQMFGRMVMSTVMQAVSELHPIIDHSFDGLPKGQPSISEFIRQNYQLVKADAIASPTSGNSFGLNKYQEKGAKIGEWIVSSGKVQKSPNASAEEAKLVLYVSASANTVGGLLDALGISRDGYITLVVIDNMGRGLFGRLKVKDNVALTTVISSETIATLFDVETNGDPSLKFADNAITLDLGVTGTSYASNYIITKKENGGYIHSTCELVVTGNPNFTSDVALPTYPTGTQQFLNGGDL